MAAGKPAISTITQNINGTFHLTGTGLNGISEGAVYGDDWQMDSNYPLVRLTDVSGNVYYARTINWSSTGVRTGNTPVSTDFVLPAGLPPGDYSLVVVANGISSDPVDFFNLPITLTLPASATEGNAPVTATVTLPFVSTDDQVIALSSSLTARATVPATVTIPAGQTSTTFLVTIVDDAIINGSQATLISATSTDYQGGAVYLVIRDNDFATLALNSTGNLFSSGPHGGPFTPPNITYTLTNTGNMPLQWTMTKQGGASWIFLSPTSGTLAPGASAIATISLSTSATNLAAGNYSEVILINNTTTGDGNTSRTTTLTVTAAAPAMSVSPGSFSATGFVGGPFSPDPITLVVSNTGTASLDWSVSSTAAYLTISATAGTIPPRTGTNLTLAFNSRANILLVGTYGGGLSFVNNNNHIGDIVVAPTVTVYPLPKLTIALSGTNVVLTWPTSAAPAFTLQSLTDLASAAVWTPVSPAPVVVNGRNTVTNQVSGPRTFYRLSQ